MEVPAEGIGFGVSSFDVGRTVVSWVDINCVVPGLEDVSGVVWEVPWVDIGLGVSSLDVVWMFVEVGSVVSCIVLPLVVEVFIGSGVSPLVEGDVPIGSVVDSFCGVCCVVSEIGCSVFWVVSGVSPVCIIGVGLSWLGDCVCCVDLDVDSVFIGFGVSPSVGPKDVPVLDIDVSWVVNCTVGSVSSVVFSVPLLVIGFGVSPSVDGSCVASVVVGIVGD